MYDRAPRTVDFKMGCTPRRVGPGTYEIPTGSSETAKADSYAPFLSMTSRDVRLNDDVPGPGSYNPSTVDPRVQGGQSLSTKEKRFRCVKSDIPGPGQYNPGKTDDDLGQAIKNAVDLRMHTGKLITSRIRYRRAPDAPSIPSHGTKYGYEERPDGTLKRNAPTEKDCSIGPAFYNACLVEPESTRLYRGIHFGKMSSKRGEFAGKEGPGPGAYDPYRTRERKGKVTWRSINQDEEPSSTKFESKVPRYNEAIIIETEKQDLPGPGRYDIHRELDPVQPRIRVPEGLQVDPPPFMSQAKRFCYVENSVPAPGKYNDPRTAMTLLKRLKGKTKTPFGQTSIRFEPAARHKGTPGPGAYNASGMGSSSMRKAYLENCRKGVFGTTSIRDNQMVRVDEHDLPGPAYYLPKERPFQPRYQHASANFCSDTDRMAEPPDLIKRIGKPFALHHIIRALHRKMIPVGCLKAYAQSLCAGEVLNCVRGAPAPDSYDVVRSYQKSQVRPTMAEPRSAMAYLKHNSFTYTTCRFLPPRDMPCKASVDPDNPGPGSYDMNKATLNAKGGLMITRDKRFKYTVNNIPGPATYELPPAVQDSVLRGTFNATLCNPLLPFTFVVRSPVPGQAPSDPVIGL